MPELLKDKYYNYHSLHELALNFKTAYSLFQADNFVSDVMDNPWHELELKARIRKITICLGKYLPADYEQALNIIDSVIAGYPDGFNDSAFVIFPDFVEVYGQDECYWDLSIAALARYTQISSSEFAVRPFIIKQEERMMKQMAAWAKNDNEHIRRLASEGCRPRLPWGQALPAFQKDPSPVLRILEELKADPSLYVRKSVANNLNDISKTHPDLVTKIAKDWYGRNDYTDWIVKHGCRTLLKKGDPEALSIFGYDNSPADISAFALGASSVMIGEELMFSFTVSAKETMKVRLEYGVDYVKANGRRNRKVFKISEILLKEGEKKSYTKVHCFADLSTRKHYPGTHSIALIINGIECEKLDFELVR
ncbi:DNA alkylation repair protein [Lachnotalea sp. AF33-28]|uniref:DNA alkylation repair protein n=1 Tax=Lachnotalea sp. AF33-28 TaxID=2292046 RepID=UPI000E49A559|nr:DNA alkylation repair protein [Lachnotalea sp. AF33-28]RHP36286.1 hypothetical protein DWZ56_01125 [Lachnotalea sp. AF33-28]